MRSIQIDPSQVTTTQPAPTGLVHDHYDATYGWQKVRPVYNGTGSTLAAASVLVFQSGSSTSVGLAAASALRGAVAGINPVAIPDGYWGWVVCGGDCLATADAAVAANGRCRVVAASGTNGRLDDTAGGADDEYIAVAIVLAAGAASTFRVRVHGLQ